MSSDRYKAESSKKGKKRVKRERAAYHAYMTMNTDSGVRILTQQDDYELPNIIARRTRRRAREALEANHEVEEVHNKSKTGQTLGELEANHEAEEEVRNNSTTGKTLEELEERSNSESESNDETLSNAYSESESSGPSYDESPSDSDFSPKRTSTVLAYDKQPLNTSSSEKLVTPSRKATSKKWKRKTPGKYSKFGVGATESDNRIEIIFNEKGQPINKESVKMISLLGYLARERVDITFNDWRKVPKETKEELWEIVKKEFILEEKSKKFVMMQLGVLWRIYKSRLRALLDSCDNEADMIAAKPDTVDPEQWNVFIRQRTSKEYQEKRKKFKEMRAKLTVSYTSSRKSYARLEAEMKQQSSNPSSITKADVWEKAHTKRNGEPANAEVAEKMKKLQEIKASATNPLFSEDDALLQVIGPEHRTRFGVAPSKLDLSQPSDGKVYQLQKQVNELKEKVSRMEKSKDEIQEQVKKMQNLMNQLMQTQTRCPNCQPEGVKCKLFRMVKEDVVAEGRWVTDDPMTSVHNTLLGEGASKVWVDSALEPAARLWRPTSEMERMQDAVGSVIAWPTNNIIKDV